MATSTPKGIRDLWNDAVRYGSLVPIHWSQPDRSEEYFIVFDEIHLQYTFGARILEGGRKVSAQMIITKQLTEDSKAFPVMIDMTYERISRIITGKHDAEEAYMEEFRQVW